MSTQSARQGKRTGFDDQWQGPYPERTPLGGLTGERFVRCKYCGIEVLVQDVEHATHKGACKHAE